MLRFFPVVGNVRYSNDWGAPRSGGRSHEGNDLIAPMGAVIVAVDDGVITQGTTSVGGNIVNLVSDDGDRFYYAHLLGFEGGNRRVKAGDIIGYVGMSGNAKGTVPHLHFEYHPENGAPVNPYPYLQRAQKAQINTLTAPQAASGVGKLVALTAIAVGSAYVLGNVVIPAFAPKSRAST